MTITVLCRQPNGVERELQVPAGKPLRLRLRRPEGGEGNLFLQDDHGRVRFSNESGLPATLHGRKAGESGHITPGDGLALSGLTLRLPPSGDPFDDNGTGEIVPETQAYGMPSPAVKEPETQEVRKPSGQGRSTRRISASKIASLDTPVPPPASSSPSSSASAGLKAQQGRSNIMDRVNDLLRRKQEDPQIRALEDERRTLLERMGRTALEQGGGFGLPKEFLAKVQQGRQASLRLEEMDRGALDRFLAARKRLAFLDAELHALRQRLGLAEGDTRDMESFVAPQLRTEAQDHEDRAFMASDAMMTEELPDDLDLEPEPSAPEPRKPVQPPRAKRVTPRRRH